MCSRDIAMFSLGVLYSTSDSTLVKAFKNNELLKTKLDPTIELGKYGIMSSKE